MKSLVLENKKEFIIFPVAPFHFDGTFHKPSYFPDKLSDWEPGRYWQTIRIDERLFGLRIDNEGEIQKPRIKFTIFYSDFLNEKLFDRIREEVIWRYELSVDLSEFNRLAQKDKRFYPVFQRWLGMRVPSLQGLYELLIIAVVLQNATVRRTMQMMNALLDNYGRQLLFDNKEIFSIWLPEELSDVSEQNLRNLKIGYRAKFIKRLSQDFVEGKIDEQRIRKLDQDSAKKELVKLYGVGPETARILLFEGFHHYNTFDHIAPWQQKIYSRLFYNKPLVACNIYSFG